MRAKWLIVAGLILAEVGVCAAIGLVSWGGLRWARDTGLRFELVADDRVSAEAVEEQRFSVTGPATLNLDNLVGSVTITGSAGSEIVVVAHKTAWGRDQAQAEAALAAITVGLAQTGDRLTITVSEPEPVSLVGDQRRGSVDFTLLVPTATAVTASTGFGEVTLTGVTGAVDLHTGSGEIMASDLAGDVSLRSGFGALTLKQSTAGTVSLDSGSGDVSLRQVQAAGAVSLRSDFGRISFSAGSALSLAVDTGSGSVVLDDLTLTETVEAHSRFGAVTLTNVAAAGYTLDSRSGDVTLDGAAGAVSAETGFGSVSVSNARDVTLRLVSGSGSIAFAGSLGAGPHTLRSDFGSIVVQLPPGSALEVDLKTDFGSLHSDLPLTLSGDLTGDHWQGTLNGGGPALTVSTGSGNIRLESISP
jgi:DUF4097 and DUF4098 domain-containing protein YvlB